VIVVAGACSIVFFAAILLSWITAGGSIIGGWAICSILGALAGQGAIPISFLEHTWNMQPNSTTADHVPGCTRGDIKDLADAIADGVPSQLKGYLTLNKASDNFCFMPTVSTLDIQNPTNGLLTNVRSLIPDFKNPSRLVTPFSAIYEFPTNDKQNLPHVQVTAPMVTWVLEQCETGFQRETNLASVYNYGFQKKELGAMAILSGGNLKINAPGATGFVATAPEPNATNSSFEVRTTSGSCGTIGVSVKSGGKLSLGEGTQSGTLRVMNGTSLTIENGGNLNAANNSQLIVESGGRLIIEAGANITLTGSESTIYVKNGGELVINGNMIFSGNGFFQFDAGHRLTLGADLVLRGSGKTTRMIRLNPSPQTTFNRLTINGRGFNLSNALVEIGNNRCEINITNGNTHENSVSDACFKGFGNGIALNFGNVSNANIQRCDFVNLTQGVNINSASNLLEIVRIEFCNFNLVNYGITISSPSWLNIPKNREVFIGNCNFNYNVGATVAAGIACRLRNMFNYSALENNTFRGYREGNLFEDVTAIELQNASLDLSGGIISNCRTGISAEKAANNNVQLISLSGGTNPEISNCETGINLVGGLSSTYSSQSYGHLSLSCARLINNLTGVRGTDIRFINNGILNSIGSNNTFQNPANSFLFDVCYGLNNIENITASNNFWAGGFNNMRFRLRTGKGASCTQGVARRIQQCAVLASVFVNCNGNNGMPLNCCNRSIISSTGAAGSILASIPIACFVGSNTTTSKQPIIADKSVVQGAVKLDEAENETFSIYPNPANETVKLDIENGNYTLKVSNTVGQTIFAQNTEGSLSVDVSKWTNGIYLFEVTDKATNKRQRSKIVVQH
jgi:hypothetical protein